MNPIREYGKYLGTAVIGLIGFLWLLQCGSARRDGGIRLWLRVEMAAFALFCLAGLAALAVRFFHPGATKAPLFFWGYIVLLFLLAALTAIAEKKRKSAAK